MYSASATAARRGHPAGTVVTSSLARARGAQARLSRAKDVRLNIEACRVLHVDMVTVTSKVTLKPDLNVAKSSRRKHSLRTHGEDTTHLKATQD
ncbi:hypothetical protein E2C01_016977 [Portunus trituberculatus]|uniref:Uncharacterized protein n=1 Tax=Portunus trituberculatus TaxID=210409 RepID=A0A5B7DQM0_PORTR|nr:hypothetical protein [Portunus trituberculatus]